MTTTVLPLEFLDRKASLIDQIVIFAGNVEGYGRVELRFRISAWNAMGKPVEFPLELPE